MSESQVFPVQSTVQLTPPYSLYLSDYAAPGSERLSVTAFLVDATRPELNVRFRLRIEGNGIKIETKPEFLPPPVTLLGGVPLQLISSDLATYFDPRNLNFTGITQREYEQRGALPEGLYQFCLEVLEYNRGVKISNTGCATAWLVLNDPPIVNLPRDNDKVRVQDPQQVVFQWTPRHRGSPNSAFNAEYDFKLVEVWPSTRNPNDAILTSPVIFQTTTSETTLIYGPAETPLEPGRRYAFQIRARAYAGADEVSLFKNNGFSQVYTFVYGDACLVPQNIVTSDIGTTRFTVNFDGAPNQTNYTLRYRLPNTANWYSTTSLTPNLTINSLQPNTRYEFQVNAGCGTFTSDYSLSTNVTTKDNPGIQYSCGVPLTPFNLDPSQLINSLKIGDVIKAGDFDVLITKVSGGQGTFSGEGVIEVSYFNQAKVKAEFTNINVSNEMRMVNGYMNVTGAGVDVIPEGVMDLMDNLDEALAQADKALDEYEANLPQQFDENAAVTSTLITVPGTATVTLGSNGSVVIVDGNGKRTEVPAGTTASVVDSSGKGYIIDSKGKVHTTTAAIATAAARREYNLKLKFAAAQDQKFGFDAKRYDPIASTYTKVEDQYLSWKSVATGQMDKVIATLEGSGIDKSKIRFELNGAVVNSQWSSGQSPMTNDQSTNDQKNDQSTNDQKNDQSTIGILGAGDGVESELIALYDAQAPVTNNNSPVTKTQVLGKLSIVTYDEIVKDLVIVPINGNKYPYDEGVLRTKLNKIYGQAVVKWNITFAQNFDVPGIDPFDDGGSGLLSNYSPDMRKVVSAYKANLQRNTYYLFLVKNPKSGTDGTVSMAGFMPRSKECGFIFVDKNGSEEAIVRTIAHELGHGAFTLQHPFADEKYTMKPQGSTNNLMDYTLSGTALYKYQWDRMRYPEIVMGLFEDDEESAMVAWSGTLVDEAHTELFDHVYASNHIGELKYLTEIERVLSQDPSKQTMDLNYDDDNDHKEWVNSWKIRVVNFETVLNNTIKVIQDAKKGEKLGKIYLRPKHIYIAKYKYNDRDYPIAIYNAGTSEVMDKVFTKLEITDTDQLDEEENKKRVYIEETFFSYFIVAFYEDGKSTPTLMIQVEKFPFSDLMHNSMEEWLKFLKILVEGQEEENNDGQYEELSVISGVQWVSQFDSGLFGDKSCFCKLKADSTCMNVCCNVASKHMLTQFGVTSIKNSNCIAVKNSANDYSSVKASGDFVKALEILETYIKPKDEGGEPILIGVHYPKTEYPGYENDCSATFHYMVVVGKGYDSEKKQNYFRFYDVGRTEESNGANTSNRLYVDKKNKKISGTYKDKVYTITEVRSNHE